MRLPEGSFRGGVTIDKDLHLVGAGARSSVINGGSGSVVTVGTFGAVHEPTVSISGVTITGGVVRSSPESVPFVGEDGVLARGGGVAIPPNADFSGGATVRISDSVITGNRVAPTHTLPLGPPCPDGPCPFADATGGGIDNWGQLTIVHTTISDNRVGTASGLSAVASDSYSGAIQSWTGSLTIEHSVIKDNTATATAPNGRFADSGAIFVEGGSLTMTTTSVTGNRASLSAALPDSVELGAVAGGVHVSNASSATIRDSVFLHNAVRMTNTVGTATAFSGGLHNDLDITLDNTEISHNTVVAAALPGSSGNAEADSGAGEFSGTITRTRMIGNSVTATSAAGQADAWGGAAISYGATVTGGSVTGNHVHAAGPHGTANALGGGILSLDTLTLRNVSVRENSVIAVGRRGRSEGGGIFAGTVDGLPDPGPIALTDTDVTQNAARGSSGVTVQGGGVFASVPVSLTRSRIAHNRPDDTAGPTP